MASVQPSQLGAAGGQYEEPPVVNVADLLPATPLSGQGYTVQPQAPTNGVMGQYTIVADPSVFHDDAGTYYVESLDMLKIRLSEIPAIAQLDNMSNSSVFANALVYERSTSGRRRRKYGHASDGYCHRAAERSRRFIWPRKPGRGNDSIVGLEFLRQRQSRRSGRHRYADSVGLRPGPSTARA